jgi:release factor glutamine methyltransferase
VLGLNRAELARTGSETLDPDQARRLARLAHRRLDGEPLQHIEGTVEFRDLVLAADSRALIPRPETEQLVDRIVAWAREHGPVPDDDAPAGITRVRRPPTRRKALLGSALDIGTGSGAIALALVHEGVVRRAVGVDVDPDALEQAAANRSASGMDEDRVELRHAKGTAWSAVDADERFDLVVSNPPYVRDGEIERLPPHVRDHEPRRALAGGRDGLDVIRDIAAGAAGHLEAGGALFLEIGADQGEAVRALLAESGAWAQVVVERDLAGKPRFVRARPALREGGR